MTHFLLSGSHPELTRAEAEAVLGSPVEHRAGPMLFVEPREWNGTMLQQRLAGAVKLGDIVFEHTGKTELKVLAERLADEIDARPRADRVLFGLTVFAPVKGKTALKKLPIELKRVLQERGRSVRWVTGDKGEITPAAVAKLKLTTEGYDFVIGMDEKRLVIGLTTNVQDADAWSLRDYGRPFRDAKTGMLPPKLARMMVNLAQPRADAGLLDPFCGGGTVLMEAALMFPGANLIGSDIDAKQVAGSKQNFEWLNAQDLVATSSEPRWIISPAQQLDTYLKNPVDAIVTEGYLGEPLRGHEPREFLLKNKEHVENVWKDALPTLAKLLNSGGRLVCVWPEFVVGKEVVATDASAAATKAGLNIERSDLKYGRPDQRVVRRIIVMKKG